MIKKVRKMSTGKKIFFALLIGFAVISLWRGIWGLLDVYLLPNDYILSLWMSIIFGASILILTGYLSRELV